MISVSQISNYKHCNNIVTVSQIWNYKQSVTTSDIRSCNQTLAPQQHSKQSVTTPVTEGTRVVGDGTLLPVALIFGRGSKGGSTSPSGVIAGEGDPSGWRVQRRCSPQRCASCGSGPPMDCKVALPVVTSALEVVSMTQIQPSGLCVLWHRPSHGRHRPLERRSGYCPMDLGTHGGVCGLTTEGRRLVDLGTKVIDKFAPRGICGTQHMDSVTQVNGPVMTEVLLLSVSTVSGHGRRSAVEPDDDGGTRSVSVARNPSKRMRGVRPWGRRPYK
jgi:hypothetical protein